MTTTKAEILAKAKEADELAAKTVDQKVKKAWQQIADNYRTLAKAMTQEGALHLPVNLTDPGQS